jgi:hypothetical protein
MADEMTTKPTIETVLERIVAFEGRFASRFDLFEKHVAERFDRVDERFDRIDNEIDRVASVAHSTKAEMLTLRADFRELRTQLREVLPVPQAS